MANFTGWPQSYGAPLFESTTDPVTNVGDIARTADGRFFRYVKCGATATVAGKLYQAPAQDTAHHDMAPTATAIGSTTITVTLGASAVTANQYAGGLAVIDATPGEGYSYLISGHPAADASASLTLTLADPVQVALTTSSDVTITPNPYSGIIVTPANTLTGAVVGVATYIIDAGEYGWVQVGGPCGVLVGGTPAVGAAVVSPGDTAGEVVVDPANAAVVIVGSMMVTGADGEYNQVLLNIQ